MSKVKWKEQRKKRRAWEERREGKEKDKEEAEKKRTQVVIDKQKKKRKKNSNMYIIGVSEKGNWSNEIGQILKYIRKKFFKITKEFNHLKGRYSIPRI